jgi:hypothetical protein
VHTMGGVFASKAEARRRVDAKPMAVRLNVALGFRQRNCTTHKAQAHAQVTHTPIEISKDWVATVASYSVESWAGWPAQRQQTQR